MIELSWIAFLASSLFLLVLWLFLGWTDDCGRLRKSGIPGNLGFFYVGEALGFYQDPLDFSYSRFAKYGNIFKTRFWGQGVVFIVGRKALDMFTAGPIEGLGASPEAYLKDSASLMLKKDSHRRSVLVSENDFQHSFKHLAILSTLTALSNKADFIENCKDIALKHMNYAIRRKPVYGARLIRDIFLQISVSILMKDCQKRNELKDLIEDWLNMQCTYPISPACTNMIWESGLRATHELEAFLSKEVAGRLSTEGDFGEDLIGCMLETAMRRTDGFGKTLNDIIEKTVLTDCWTLIQSLSVHTAGACCWLFVCFERYHRVKEAALTEVRNCRDCLSDGNIRTDETLPFLEATIKESLRMYGFLNTPHLQRIALHDIEFESYIIPKGTTVMLPLNTYNFSNDTYADASSFIPERFMEGGAHRDCPVSNYSFGVGEHACPGHHLSRVMLKLVSAVFLHNYHAIAEESQSYKPLYPRGKPVKSTLRSESANSRYYFPVPEDLLIYKRFSSRF